MTTEYTSADDLITGGLDLGGEDLLLPSGKRVRVRGLSRAELIRHGENNAPADLIEVRNVAACLVQPRLTEAKALKWQQSEGAGGDFKVLSEKIRDLSGLGEGAQKSDVDPARD